MLETPTLLDSDIKVVREVRDKDPSISFTPADESVRMRHLAVRITILIDRLALVLGSEGHGLSARWERSADRRAIIPMREGIDSLNVAAATAVACYAAARR